MTRFLLLAFCLLLFGGSLCDAGTKGIRASDAHIIRDSFDALYRFQFQRAYQTINQYIQRHPEDPIGYAVLSSISLFEELDRLSILEGEFFQDDEKIKGNKKLKPDPAIRQRVFECVDKALKLANEDLAKDPKDTNALFAMTFAEGITMDYLALVDKKQSRSLKHARAAQTYAVRLLKIDPEFYDVYCTTGFSEYLLGSLPFFMRWFIKFDDTEGSKEEGLRKLQIAATKGDYFKPFAKLLLAIFYLRQKEPELSERYLAQYEALYPENPLVRKERSKLMEMIASREAADQLAK
jgi:hypothetical protein